MDHEISKANTPGGDWKTSSRINTPNMCQSRGIHHTRAYIKRSCTSPSLGTTEDLSKRVSKGMKGRSSRKMMEEFGELRRKYWGRHMWARGYFAASTGNVTDEIIAEYIEKQSKISPEDEDQNFSIEDL